MDESTDAWFKREVLIHEPMLMRFIARVWPRREEWADIRQEAYARVYEAARASRPHTPKAFLFSTTRHLMTDRLRRERIVSIYASGDSEFLDVLVDEMSPERLVSAREELARLARAFDRLPDTCRTVLWMRRVKDIPQKEVAASMGFAEKTIEKYLRMAVQKLADLMTDSPLQRVDRYRGTAEAAQSTGPFDADNRRRH